MFGGKKQVLIVGNDAVQLYLVANKKVALYGDFPTSSETLTEDLRNAFTQAKAPLLILFDVAEQQYRKEVIPAVSKFDKNKVIQRKLLMAFPQQQMRAFLPLKQNPGEEGLTLVFAALGMSDIVEKIMSALLGSEIFVAGTGLLPLESCSLVTKLVQMTHERAKTGNDTRWSVLMTYHQTGGLRQIVIKDGELALTRLTPMSIDVNNTQQLTDEMAREFNSTLIYLSRFGYIPSDGLDLIIVSAPEVCQHFRELPLPVTHLYPLTPGEAGQLIGLTMESQQTSVFSDILHAAWGGIQRKIAVPLTAPVISKIKSARQASRAVVILLFLASCYLLYQNTILETDSMALQSDIAEQKAKRQVLQHETDELTKELNVLKYDPEKIRTVITLSDTYSKKNLDAEPFLQSLIALLDRGTMKIKDFNMVEADETTAKAYRDEMAAQAKNAPPPAPSAVPTPTPGVAPDAKNAGDKPVVTIKLTMGFNPNLPIEQAATLTNDFVARFKQKMPTYKISIATIVGNLAVDKTIQGASEQLAQGKIDGLFVKDGVSSFVITGALQ